jgi:hypothetical protein
MRTILTWLLLVGFTVPLAAQVPVSPRVAICGVDVVCSVAGPPVPVIPPAAVVTADATLLQAMQTLAAQQAAIDARLTNLTAQVNLLPPTPQPSRDPIVQALADFGAFLSKPAVLAVVGTLATCDVSKKC